MTGGREWMLIADAAEYAECSTKTLRRAIAKGALRGYKQAGRWRFDRAEVDSWIQGALHSEVPPPQRPGAPSVRRGFLSNVYDEIKDGTA
ncbi:MAG: Helix-turn-helix domain [Thermoleophilia bacterium]|nr:Helix-turn-helix domain [Thermoleophilia bacterium]